MSIRGVIKICLGKITTLADKDFARVKYESWGVGEDSKVKVLQPSNIPI